MSIVKQLVGGVKDGAGCIFSILGVLVIPICCLALTIAIIKFDDVLFPENPQLRAQQCSDQKQRFQRAMFCETVYSKGEQFLSDPTSTYGCSDGAISQQISFRSPMFKFRLDSCSNEDAKLFSKNALQHVLQSQMTFSECEKGSNGRDLGPEVQKQFDAFLACRRYETAP